MRRDENAGGAVVRLRLAADDATLVAALRRGDPRAQRQLFDAHAVRVKRLLAYAMGADAELDDLLHDTFLDAFASIGGLEDASAVGSWLATIAIRKARRAIKKRQRARLLAGALSWLAPERYDPHPSMSAAVEWRAVSKILERLPTEERIAFAMHDIGELQLGDVAAAMGTSVTTVKRRLARGRERFRRLVEREPALADRRGGGDAG